MPGIYYTNRLPTIRIRSLFLTFTIFPIWCLTMNDCNKLTSLFIPKEWIIPSRIEEYKTCPVLTFTSYWCSSFRVGDKGKTFYFFLLQMKAFWNRNFYFNLQVYYKKPLYSPIYKYSEFFFSPANHCPSTELPPSHLPPGDLPSNHPLIVKRWRVSNPQLLRLEQTRRDKWSPITYYALWRSHILFYC